MAFLNGLNATQFFSGAQLNGHTTLAPFAQHYVTEPATPYFTNIPSAQLAAPLSTAHFAYNGLDKARTEAASAQAAAANAAAAAQAARFASAQAADRAKYLTNLAEVAEAKLQKDLDEAHISHSRIARQVTYPCLGF